MEEAADEVGVSGRPTRSYLAGYHNRDSEGVSEFALRYAAHHFCEGECCAVVLQVILEAVILLTV